MDNSLKELTGDEIHLLLDELKSDWPLNIHAFSFVNTIQKWKIAGSDYRSKVLALNGDVKSKFIAFYSSSPDKVIQKESDIRGSVHKWTHRGDDDNFFLDVLHNSRELIPWDAKTILLTALTPETTKVIVPFLTEIWKGQEWSYDPGHHLYWIPKEIAEEWTIEVPDGTYLSLLTEAHVKEIDELYVYRWECSAKLFSSAIKFNFGLGLFDSTSGELLSWAVHMDYGGVGALKTKDQHLRKGYGRVIVRAMCKEIAKQGESAHLDVMPLNIVSVSLMRNCELQLACSPAECYKGL